MLKDHFMNLLTLLIANTYLTVKAKKLACPPSSFFHHEYNFIVIFSCCANLCMQCKEHIWICLPQWEGDHSGAQGQQHEAVRNPILWVSP